MYKVKWLLRFGVCVVCGACVCISTAKQFALVNKKPSFSIMHVRMYVHVWVSAHMVSTTNATESWQHDGHTVLARNGPCTCGTQHIRTHVHMYPWGLLHPQYTIDPSNHKWHKVTRIYRTTQDPTRNTWMHNDAWNRMIAAVHPGTKPAIISQHMQQFTET
jgi:hypothetical protein